MSSVLSMSVFTSTFALATLKHTGAFTKDADFEKNIMGCGITTITTLGAAAIATLIAPPITIPVVLASNALYAYTPQIVRKLL